MTASTGRQAAWNYLAFGLSKTSTLIMTIIVARVLTPAEFGQFALALLVVNFFDYVKDLGVGAALVQSPRSWNQLAPTGFTLSVLFGTAAGVIAATLAPVAAMALHHTQLTPLIQVLAIGLVIAALSAIPAARLRRNLDFRRRIWPEFLSAATKAVLTIVLAVEGFGVWSLVYGQLAGTVALTVLYWWVSRTPIECGFDRQQARDLLRFGLPHSGATLLAFAIYNIDYLAIGVRLGDYQLGLYTIAYRLPELLVLNLCAVISEVLFSSLSRLQHVRQQLARQYLRVMTVATALTAPISVALAAAAAAVIGTLYGQNYAAAAPVLTVLSVYTLIYSASWHAGDVFKAVGRPSLLVVTSTGKLAVMIGPIWWAAGHGIVRVGLVLLAAEVAHLAANLIIVRAVAGLALRTLAKAMLAPMPAAVVMGAAVLATGRLTTGWSAPWALTAALLVGALSYVGGLRLSAPDLYFAGLAVVRSALGRSAAGLVVDDRAERISNPEGTSP